MTDSNASPAPSVGASDILNGGSPPPGGAPPPMSRRQAIDRLETLRHDPQWTGKLERNDSDARAELAKLTGLISHVSLTAGQGIDAAAISAELGEATNARAMMDRENRVASMRKFADVPDDVADMIRKNTPVSRAEKDRIAQEKRILFADPEFVKNYLSGRRRERSQMVLISIVEGAPTLDPLPASPGTTIDY